MKTKKSAIDLTDLALGIIVLGIVVSIGASVLITTRDSRLTDLSTVQTGNETILASDGGTLLTNSWLSSSTLSVTNATGGEIIQAGNYSTSISSVDGSGTVTFVGTSSYNGTNVNATYSWYNTSREDYALANDAAIGIGEYGNWFKIIVIVAVAAVVLGLIFASFGRGRSGIGGSY